MIEKMLKNKKYKDYYNFNNSECKISIIISIIVIIIALNPQIDLFENFSIYKAGLQNITIYIASGLLAMIGVILAGIALLLGLLDDEFKKSIKDVVPGEPVKEIMLSFEFLAINLGFASLIFFVIHFFLYVNIYIDKIIFYILIFISVYYFTFLVFYTIALISNSIELYLVKDIYKEISNNEKSMYDKANEVRIDYILLKILKQEERECLLQELEEIVDEMGIDEKESIKKYFKDYYDK